MKEDWKTWFLRTCIATAMFVGAFAVLTHFTKVEPHYCHHYHSGCE